MQDLTPVGLSKDGKLLLLISTSGEEFAVPVDTRLRAALRGDNARLGQLEMKMESALRPRDIQARIRAGESPEDVATAAQTTVEAIMGFATPVLAERAHVAQSAQKASVRRKSGESSPAGRTLGEVADAFFSGHSLYDQDVAWDAWRRSDGRWALVAEFTVAGTARRAEFVHDLPGRFVVADNDEARMLTGELAPPGRGSAGATSTGGRRLSSVPASQDELPLGDDAIELVRDRPGDASDEPGEAGATGPTGPTGPPLAEEIVHAETPPEPLETPAPAAAHAAAPPLDLTAETADADWLVVDHPAPAEPAAAAEAAETGAAETSGATGATGATGASETEKPAEEPASGAQSKKKGRSSVPSWDEIMFGGGKAD